MKGEDHKGPSLARQASTPLLGGFAVTCVGVSQDMSKSEFLMLTLMASIPGTTAQSFVLHLFVLHKGYCRAVEYLVSVFIFPVLVGMSCHSFLLTICVVLTLMCLLCNLF